ncbi:MAG: polyprenyl synthetase family protein [Planctomycetota bacterium]|nr:MAG: polyprenyl synthetase family protein [Planctomycetota bacterium]REJ93142.1 MAG: polyprenyl synthetase family protein [Planctomycetota bacterium]REK21826.1 MAG: polyprenyl synthetase family protein [Planctomycetota bacterium]REK37626.1 MAG: polyprenyl synthetase family protein [Planctomycetota bacterium]
MASPTISLNDRLAELQTQVEGHLSACLDLSLDCPPRLREAMAYSLLSGGKRLRPILVLLACEVCEGDLQAAMPAACAIEMVHTYSLIHDDLPSMDDDDLRRGRPTCHRQFDEATAILAGDALLTLAFEVIARRVQPPELAAACCADLAAAAGAEGMVAGQIADLQAESADPTGRENALAQLEAIHRRKTGRLLSAALILGARIAAAPPETQRRLHNYGDAVGLAFQIADDLLDIRGNAAKMGKNVGKDADHGKLTYPALLGEEASLQRAKSLVNTACHELQPFGARGRTLEALARYVIERDR